MQERRLELIQYPLAIEPVSNFVEVQVRLHQPGPAAQPAKTYWCAMQRLPPRWNYPLPGAEGDSPIFVTSCHNNRDSPPADSSVPHLFGNSKHLSRSDIVLGYSAEGVIATIWRREGREWVEEAVPEERRGEVPTAPSLRITFGSEEERQAFVDLLRTLGRTTKGTVPDQPAVGARSDDNRDSPPILGGAKMLARLLPAGQKLAERALRNMAVLDVARPKPAGKLHSSPRHAER